LLYKREKGDVIMADNNIVKLEKEFNKKAEAFQNAQ
jgi:hypothetical protein